MNDVSAGMRALAQDVEARHAAGAGLPVQAMAARARGRRRRRAAAATAGAAAAVVAVAVGAGAVGDAFRAPLPADTPTVTPSASAAPHATPTPAATPTTTTAAVTLPTGDPTRPFGDCGSLVGAAPAFPSDPALLLAVGDLPRTVAAGAPLTFTVTLSSDGGGTLVRPAAGPRVVVTRDGVVVATTDVYGGARTDAVAEGGWMGVTAQVGAVGLAVCAADGASAGAALPAGGYELWFVGEAAFSDADPSEVDVDAVAAAGRRGTVVHGPSPLTIEGAADAPWHAPAATSDLTVPPVPEPGEAAPPSPTQSGPWRLTHDTGPLELAAADLADPGAEDAGLQVPGTLTYSGPGRVAVQADVVVVHWLVQDGRVVATSYLPTDRHTGAVELGAGQGYDLGPEALPVARCGPAVGPGSLCSAEGGPVAPGDYTLLPGVVIHGGTMWTTDAGERRLDEVLGATGPYVVLGAPVPLTLR